MVWLLRLKRRLGQSHPNSVVSGPKRANQRGQHEPILNAGAIPTPSDPNPTPSAPLNTSSFLTRIEAMDLLGVSYQTIINYETKGLLSRHEVMRADKHKVERRTVVYEPKELARLPRRQQVIAPRDPGEIAARATELFNQGHNQREVVVALRESFDTVRELHEKWFDAGGSQIVISPPAKTALEEMVGPFDDVADLVTAVARLLKTSGSTLLITAEQVDDISRLVGAFSNIDELIACIAARISNAPHDAVE